MRKIILPAGSVSFRNAVPRWLPFQFSDSRQGMENDGITSWLTQSSYIGGIALLLGAAFWMLTGKPDKVAKEAIKDDPKFAAEQRGSRVK